MTTVTIFRSREGLVGFEASGHADYADEGSDIVCSAVSALTQTAVMGITQVLKITAPVEIRKASVYCVLPKDISPEKCEKAQIILDTMAMGLSSIANTYGDYINITERKV